jgi:hypothetical protein
MTGVLMAACMRGVHLKHPQNIIVYHESIAIISMADSGAIGQNEVSPNTP